MDNEKSESNVKKVVYVCVFIAIVAIIATIIAIVAARSGAEMNAEGNSSGSVISSSSVNSSSSRNSSSKNSSSNNISSSDSGGDVEPTIKEIAFIMPVESGIILKDYTAASVVYNQTLGIYTGHLALDVGGAENAKVFAAYDGEVVSIVESYLEGTTVTIDHGDGLKTVYNSIETNDGLSIGDRVLQGEEIGVISTNNRQEYKDGAHLHFEVWENGQKISPYKYLTINEK